jgi:hypothetical protein
LPVCQPDAPESASDRLPVPPVPFILPGVTSTDKQGIPGQRLRLPTVSPTGPGMPAPVITSGSPKQEAVHSYSTVHTCAGDESWMIVWTLLFTQAPRHVPHECHPLGIVSPCRHVPHLVWRHSSRDRVGKCMSKRWPDIAMSGFVLCLVCLCDVCALWCADASQIVSMF